jgi:hypothetical protein
MCSRSSYWVAIAVLTLFSGLATAQNNTEKRTLVLNGRTGEITIFMVDGTPFVNLRTLVEIGNGNVAFNGTTIVLTFSGTSASSQTVQAPSTPFPSVSSPPQPPLLQPPPSSAMSGDFMSAAIRMVGILKEWRSYIAYGITKGVPGDGSRMVLNQNQATEALRLAQVAASTDADRNAYKLLRTDFDNVNQWYKALVEGRKNMNTANYSMSEEPLKDDSQYQKIVACSDFLGTMIPSGTFSDDGSCR